LVAFAVKKAISCSILALSLDCAFNPVIADKALAKSVPTTAKTLPNRIKAAVKAGPDKTLANP